jgi:AcrR family transcriptional regulator
MSADTKTRILDTAEKLFAVHGIEGAGLRLISQEAGVNLAAINYHFRTKENLVRTVVSRLVLPLDEERNRLLEQARGAPVGREGGERLQDLVRAFVMPWVSFRRKHPQYVRILAMIYGGKNKENVLFRDMIRDTSRQAYALFTRSACAALPAIPREILLMRINLAVALAASFLLNPWVIEGLEDLSGLRIDEETLVDSLTRLIESGLPGENPPDPR